MKKTMKNKKCHGFYLIEAIIALFLVTVGLLVTIDLLTKTMSGNIEDRDSVIAVMLSQEGIELVRNLRDNNAAKGYDSFCSSNNPDPVKCPPSNQNFPGSAASNQQCRIDKNSAAIDCVSTIDHKKLYLDGNKYYVHNGATGTKFYRRIIIHYYNELGGDATEVNAVSAKVVSVVGWGSSPIVLPRETDGLSTCTSAVKCVYAQTILTRWAED